MGASSPEVHHIFQHTVGLSLLFSRGDKWAQSLSKSPQVIFSGFFGLVHWTFSSLCNLSRVCVHDLYTIMPYNSTHFVWHSFSLFTQSPLKSMIWTMMGKYPKMTSCRYVTCGQVTTKFSVHLMFLLVTCFRTSPHYWWFISNLLFVTFPF